MRLPRCRVRTLMLAVSAVAVLFWGSMMGARSYDYYRRARFYGEQAYGWREIAARGRFRAEFSAECAEYFAQLTRKYRRAMWRPWMPVASDPHAPGYDQWLEQERRAKEVAPDPLARVARTTGCPRSRSDARIEGQDGLR
jgi:hypothetical protein